MLLSHVSDHAVVHSGDQDLPLSLPVSVSVS